jgi:hypothetical protein
LRLTLSSQTPKLATLFLAEAYPPFSKLGFPFLVEPG